MKRPSDTATHVVAAILIIVMFTGYLLVCQWLYGDWRCALAQCRLEK